ncbi:relaxin-3 receptor 1-like [Brienomyrus brachyistius]|uniref:relaxin-3 receptor 1-like n=1 Tax=Brienomyrus brachyistius TaxID=42636 RepID=UPI0020B42387|nr:relaxin-3 receptor 1-like [Brienomyrus brachyistius]
MVDINCTDIFNRSFSDQERFSSLEDIDVIADGTPLLRIIISVVYSAVCVAGLVGNLLVFFLMKAKQGSKRSTINFFVLNLAVTDFQFVLTLPFWAVDTALDFSWPFGHAMCKIILSVTVMNMYASVFFLTAMSITRYRSVASVPRSRSGRLRCSVRWAAALLWLCATAATAPTSIFSTVTSIAGEKLCLLRFPDGQYWLALYHLQKILLAFVLPLLIVSACYLLLLRFIRQRSMNSSYPKRRSKVTKTVTIVVLSFFLCWMPNHAITFWGVLVKLNMARWDSAYYMVHTYLFPLSVCLAHVHSCLNPLLYCLMRRDFRRKLKDLFWRISLPVIHNNNNNNNPMHPFSDEFQPQQENTPNVIHLNVLATDQYRLSTINGQWETDINK